MLLKKANTITTPTAYSNGFLHSVKPEVVLGEELVVNGDFSDGTNNWTAGGGANISVSNNQLTIQADNDFSFYARQSVGGFVLGKKYKLTIDIAGGTTSRFRISVYGEGLFLDTSPLTTGIHSAYFTITKGASGSRFIDIYNANEYLLDSRDPNDPLIGPEKVHTLEVYEPGGYLEIQSYSYSGSEDLHMFVLSACPDTNIITSDLIREEMRLGWGGREIYFAPGTYYIIVDGFQVDGGMYALEISGADGYPLSDSDFDYKKYNSTSAPFQDNPCRVATFYSLEKSFTFHLLTSIQAKPT